MKIVAAPRLPCLRCGGEGAFPRVSVQQHRPATPQRFAGHKRPFPPLGRFAEKQPPRRLSGALLFRPFSWARKKKASPKAWEGWGEGVDDGDPKVIFSAATFDFPHRISRRLSARLLRLPLKGGVTRGVPSRGNHLNLRATKPLKLKNLKKEEGHELLFTAFFASRRYPT